MIFNNLFSDNLMFIFVTVLKSIQLKDYLLLSIVPHTSGQVRRVLWTVLFAFGDDDKAAQTCMAKKFTLEFIYFLEIL